MSGPDGILVDHGALARGAQDLLGAAGSIRSRLDQLDGDLRPLATDWTGAARDAYARAQQRWDRAMAEMVVLLRDVGAGVDGANADYHVADRRGAGRF
jgi:6 kDa early secretory antigenic target